MESLLDLNKLNPNFKYTLSLDQTHFLIEHVKNERLKNIIRLGKTVVILSGEERAQLENELTELLCNIGLDKSDEPNKTGLLIEHLIDIFHRE